MTGAVKWTAAIPKTTYGGGVAVGKDGTLYQGARNATLYAINSDGSQKWTYATGAANKNLDCFPAVTADGQTVYVLDGDNVLHSINTATGAKNWNVKLTGTKNKAGAVAIDKKVISMWVHVLLFTVSRQMVLSFGRLLVKLQKLVPLLWMGRPFMLHRLAVLVCWH